MPYRQSYALAPGTAPLARCAGAFRRTCLMLTDRVLCDACWAEVGRVEPEAYPGVRSRFRPAASLPREPFDDVWTAGAVDAPIRGTVE